MASTPTSSSPVKEASAQLWTVKEPADVVKWLKILHRALLDANQYDPSDVFLAIQSASIRFDTKTEGEPIIPAPALRKEILLEAMLSTSVLARVCVGPAWWHQALQRRRLRSRNIRNPHHRSQFTETTLPDDSSSNVDVASSSNGSDYSSNRSWVVQENIETPPVDSFPNSLLPLMNNNNGPVYLPIPEILPAAMLRFAADAVEKADQLDDGKVTDRMKLVEAQLSIIQHLCCAHQSAVNYHDRDVIEWNIPGAHGFVGLILASILRMVCMGRPKTRGNIQQMLSFIVADQALREGVTQVDTETNSQTGSCEVTTTLPPVMKDQWKHILLVTQVTADLLSSGWRPLPQGRNGHDVILSLLVIASRGIKLGDLTASKDETAGKAREERLVATSCAAEALSSLFSLVTRGLIPTELQATLVRTSCTLCARLDATIGKESKLLYPRFGSDRISSNASSGSSSGEDDDEIDHQIAFFRSQRELCLTDTTGIIWAMLSTEGSVEQTIAVLFSIIEVATQATSNKDSIESPLFNKVKWNDQTEDYFLADCATVVRLLSSALWGVAPDFANIPLLRLFWHSAIDAIGRLLSTVYSQFAVSPESPRGVKAAGKSNYFTKQVAPVVIEAIGALHTAIEAEIRPGIGILSSLEWATMVEWIENAVLPWLQYAKLPNKDGCETVHSTVHFEAKSLLLCLSDVLDHCVDSERAHLMEYPFQRRLFLSLLRYSNAMDANSAETLDLSVVRAWTTFGFFPYRLEGWSDTAAEILQEVFSRQTDNAYSHTAAVRAEALKLLTCDQDDREDSEVPESEAQPKSVLTMAKILQDVYTDLVTKSILPTLAIVLEDGRNNMNAQQATGISRNCAAMGPSFATETLDASAAGSATDSQHEENDSTKGSERSLAYELDLQVYAVGLSGRLYLDRLIDRKQGSLCLALLQSAALRKRAASKALQQLELCLSSIFRSLPLWHEQILLILDVICKVLLSSAESLSRDEAIEKSRTLGNYALRLLGRLYLLPNCGLGYHARSDVTTLGAIDTADTSFPDNLSHLYETTFRPRVPPETTVASFSLVTSSLFAVLRTTNQLQSQAVSATMSSSSIRLTCFFILNSFLGQGVVLKIPEDAAEIFRSFPSSGAQEEERAKLASLMGIVEQMIARAQGWASYAPLPAAQRKILHLLPLTCEECDFDLAIKVFQTVSSLEDNAGVFVADDVRMAIISRLERELQESPAGTSPTGESKPIGLLLMYLTIRKGGLITKGLNTRIYNCCYGIISESFWAKSRSLTLHVALRCMLKVIDELTPEESRSLQRCFSHLLCCREFSKNVEDNLQGDAMEGFCAPIVIQEAIERSILQELESQENSLPSISKHLALTIECDNIENFPVEQDHAKVATPRAAWIFGKSIILSCRVASSTTRFRGHIEIVLRSPLTRKRILVPIPGAVSLEDPEFPCLLRYAKQPDEKDSKGAELPEDDNHEASSFEVFDKARAMLERFDSMFSQNDESADEDCLVGIPHDDDMSTALSDGFFPAGDSAGATAQTSIEASFGPDEMRSLSDRSGVSRPTVGTGPSDKYFQDWLLEVFEWDFLYDEKIHLQLADYLRPYAITISNSNDWTTFGAYKLLNKECKQLCYDAKLERAISILDRTAPSNTYKFSLLYLGSSHEDDTPAEARVLGVTLCSPAFHKFASKLGDITPTRHLRYFSAGLDSTEYESDGKYTVAWSSPENSETVVFHVANMMPENFNNRKRHIGNDNVLILFDEMLPSNVPCMNKTHAAPIVSGHFNFATILVKMLPHVGLYRVVCRIRMGLSDEISAALVPFAGDNIVPEVSVASFVRRLAMNIDTACRVIIDGLPPPSNSLERCRQIQEMKRYAM